MSVREFIAFLILQYGFLGLLIGCAIKHTKDVSWGKALKAGLLWFLLIPQSFESKQVDGD